MFKKIIFLGALAAMNASASTYNGTVGAVVCHTINSICQIELNDPHTGEACATQAWKFSFDGTTPEGRNILSILLAAQATQKTVQIGGKGTCTLAGGSEDVRHVFLNTPK